ncbi:MAG: SpoIID/LytB domain-containing protein [Defluviitaleaceae bacterium]|nr:SpoIID/LytB domain-containing protein [Defluviitaleaceae bacterium]
MEKNKILYSESQNTISCAAEKRIRKNVGERIEAPKFFGLLRSCRAHKPYRSLLSYRLIFASVLLAAFVFFAACSAEEAGEPPYVPLSDAYGNIRVILGTTNFEGLIHENVEITSDSTFYVQSAGIMRFEAGEIFVPDSLASPPNSTATIRSAEKNGRLQILTINRNHPDGLAPSYRGTLEVTNTICGGFTIINELPLEQYLYAVVPSEMPSSFGVEASKVQAVTARTFALHQIRRSAFRYMGAHVDDSVISQVYNNLPENDISIRAVRATRGHVLTYNGEIILANYFSTSGGTTANFGEVWATGAEFPSNTPSFLRARGQVFEPISGDLRTEYAASRFFRSTEISAVDRDFPWFRWQVTMTTEELTQQINANLAARQAANPAMIHILDENGNPTNLPAETIGTLTHLAVTRRGQGGNIMEMIFYGTDADVRVQTEFNIRTFLNPGTIPVQRHDGTFSQNLTLLPSAFFTMELDVYEFSGEEGWEHAPAAGTRMLRAVTFYGGGNGHGVGMSQNGVRVLLGMGLDYAQILQHYYPGTEILYIPQGMW